MIKYFIFAPLILLGACAPSPSADFLKALSGDTASLCVTFTTIYGSFSVARTNYPNATLSCPGANLQHGGGTSVVVPKIGSNGVVTGFEIQK